MEATDLSPGETAGQLTADDLNSLAKSYITPELARRSGLFRVDSQQGAEIVGRRASGGADYSGIVFPYTWPGIPGTREYRLRRDKPDYEEKNGKLREVKKYVSPPGRGNILYIPPDTPAEWLTDITVSATVVEGEKKAIAADRFYRERGEKRLVIGLSGVWNWRGIVGKTTNEKGERVDVKGPIPDLARIAWGRRVVLVVFDSNVTTNESVRAARDGFCKDLRGRGASSGTRDLPQLDGINGIDDLLALHGPNYVAGVLAGSASSATDDSDTWEEPSLFVEEQPLPFPTDVLPDVIKKHVEELACETQTPEDLAAMLDLTIAGASIARVVRIKVRGNWTEPLNIYSVCALPPGSRKSPVYDKCVEPLELEQKSRHREMEPEIAEKKAELHILERKLENAIKAAAKKAGQEGEAKRLAVEVAEKKAALPVPPKLIVDDITPERLKTEIAAQDGRIALLSAEGDIFEVFAGRYSGGVVNIDVLVKAWGGDTMHVDRSSRSEYVDRPALSMGLTTQPDVIRGLGSKPGFRAKGALARLLMTLPADPVGSRQTRCKAMDPETQENYETTIRELSRLKREKDDKGIELERWLFLTSEANREVERLQTYLEPKLRIEGELGLVRDWVAKLPGATVRIAGILHIIDHAKELTPWPEKIDKETMLRAIEIGFYLLAHARRAFNLMDLDPRIVDAKYVAKWIENHVKESSTNQFSRRQAHRGMNSHFQTVDDLEAPLRVLEDHGHIRPLKPPDDRGRGRPSQIYQISPFWIPMTKMTKTAELSKNDNKLGFLSFLSSLSASPEIDEVDWEASDAANT